MNIAQMKPNDHIDDLIIEPNTFYGDVKTYWGPRRKMILLDDVFFIDSLGILWRAQTGSEIDGASIPRFFWRFIGSPFVGLYRRASVIHDVACVERNRPHQEVHRMFYDAMIADNVPKIKARIMYMAVRVFGPKWLLPDQF